MSELIKQYFMQGYATEQMNLGIVSISIIMTAVLSAYIFIVYKYINKKSFYNKNYNLALMSIAIITAAIILTIQSNIVVSLGMVGALSIIRFRTAIKDPLDLVFMFWSISVGIICGAGFGAIAVIATVVLTIVVFWVSHSPVTKDSMILVLNLDNLETEEKCIEIVKEYSDYCKIRAKSVNKIQVHIALEVEIENEKQILRELVQLEGVSDVSIVENMGDVTA